MSSSPVQNTDRFDSGVALLIDHFQSKENFVSLFSTYAEQTQELEDTFFDLFNGFQLDTAEGAQLDAIGEIVGADRGGLSDTNYRFRIRARVLLNVTSGTPNQILAIVAAVLAGASFPSAITFSYTPYYPASFLIELFSTLDNVDDTLANEIALALIEATPAGVQSALIYSNNPDNNTFTFADGATPDADIPRGFRSLSGAAGGTWAGVISNV